MSNLGKWDPWYSQLPPDAAPQPYGATPTYEMGARWLNGCEVEDWGCGKGWMRNLIAPGRYIGVDGSASPFADVVVDLVEYRNLSADSIFMRGVLEHDYRWEKILENAVASFLHRMALVLFTPMIDKGWKEIGFTKELGVPDLSLGHGLLMTHFEPLAFCAWRDIESPGTAYGTERIYFLEK